VHKDVHWCLAIINMKENTFHYLDSLGGTDHNVLNMLVSLCLFALFFLHAKFFEKSC
jgi:Ulp1 family protease